MLLIPKQYLHQLKLVHFVVDILVLLMFLEPSFQPLEWIQLLRLLKYLQFLSLLLTLVEQCHVKQWKYPQFLFHCVEVLCPYILQQHEIHHHLYLQFCVEASKFQQTYLQHYLQEIMIPLFYLDFQLYPHIVQNIHQALICVC